MPVAKIDEKGRILLPKEIRDRMNIKPGEEFLVADIERNRRRREQNCKKEVQDF